MKAGYKTHISMDQDSEIVTALTVTPMNAEDGPQLLPLLADEAERGLLVTEVAADTAYSDGPIREGLAEPEKAIVTHIPEPKAKGSQEGKFTATDFTYLPESQSVRCPAGQVVLHGRADKSKDGWNFNFPKATCAACPLRGKCLSEKELNAGVKHGRTVYINKYRKLHDAARAHQKTEEHKAAMNTRLGIEHKNDELLNRHGLRHARYRGLKKMKMQAYLTAAVANIKRTMKLLAEAGRKVVEGTTRGEVCLAP